MSSLRATTLRAASREALEAAQGRLDEVLAEQATEPAALGAELYAVVELLSTEIPLRRAVADASSDAASRTRLVRQLLSDKVAESTLQVLDEVVVNRWSSPRELLDGIELLAGSALLARAERDGTLDTVEDELFRAGRLIAGNVELERALSDHAAPAAAKRELIRRLFADKVNTVTVTLLENVITLMRGRGVVFNLDELAERAAVRRQRSVAHVISARALSEEQQRQLAERLQGIYARPIALHVEIDPAIGGGLIVKVGDEVIDGSAAGQLDALRRQLAG
ncbi:ATP synthase F1 subcomplex delta subunit [Tamaricihabitans halophyticus]|uniref:ATP synthase subunit delta n=1 Tax=Tamaricihabitans halophyticus TaxID=1262583 RepID=A0A4R2QYP7_9PSEU|nr:F0F1 ATP synthase subunit delta [Tamaricihabitans halophyticus]TCP54817.1 ATP synthase F1 subcomplex delta subunit [Tamaricihabitans halophyticus]